MRRLVLAAALALTSAAPAAAAHGPSATFAVIGDTPYGDAQVERFPALVRSVDADPDVRAVLHVGDIKNGSSTCTTERFRDLAALLDTFDDPFVYTPGDNEWTDCHRPAAGGYLPTERLAVLREIFFPRPGRTALGGRPLHVDSQAAPHVENATFVTARTVVSTVHVVGSSNGLQPWFGAAETPAQRDERLAEHEARLRAALDWLDRTFALAWQRRARGVVLAMQADTFAGSTLGFEEVNERIEALATAFGGPVLLLQGDTHRFKDDRPFAGAPNVRRVVVEGETAGEWLRLTVAPASADPWRVERVPVPTAP